jgi:Ribbon-helix-helix protein
MPAMPAKTESKTARLTLLLDPRKKAMFEQICAEQDLTPSQVVRQLIREYIIEHAGSRPLPHWLIVASKQAGGLRRRQKP